MPVEIARERGSRADIVANKDDLETAVSTFLRRLPKPQRVDPA